MQKSFLLIGVAFVLLGVFWPWLAKLSLGQLPGDIVIERPGFRFYFPLTTMLLVSALLSGILFLLRK